MHNCENFVIFVEYFLKKSSKKPFYDIYLQCVKRI